MKGSRLAVFAAVVAAAAAGCRREPLSQPGSDAGGFVAVDAGNGFAAVAPCEDEGDYAPGSTIRFGFFGDPGSFVYQPACLTVSIGSTVTFSGDFGFHPLYPSPSRGRVVGNPITGTSAGAIKQVAFTEAGLYGYYCGIHGAADDGSTMAGVIWVQPEP